MVQSLRTRQEWSDVVDQMARFGAEASDQEFDQILDLPGEILLANPDQQGDCEGARRPHSTFLRAVAEAIVAYRTEKGDFKTIDDVKKVPGLEAGKVDAQKARVVF